LIAQETLQIAEKSSGDTALGSVKLLMGAMLTYRSALVDHQRGLELLTQVRDKWLRKRTRLHLVPAAEAVIARERTRRGDRDGAIPVIRSAAEDLFQAGQLGACVMATAVLVETLLARGAESDIAEAQRAIDRLESIPEYEGSAVCDNWLVRLRALLFRAHGDDVAYQDLVNRYRSMAKSLDFEGHIAMAEETQSIR
jgi:hypothetical protein